jgi:hypothetical protein
MPLLFGLGLQEILLLGLIGVIGSVVALAVILGTRRRQRPPEYYDDE